MLKTCVDDHVWLVHQPDHARVAGYLAAHWGGSGDFVKPGHYVPSPHAELFRQEVVHAIAEHDNGWWEWEASPSIDLSDHLPLSLQQQGSQNHDEGLKRWRLGVPRFIESHPYISLLISLHSYWLYAFAFEDASNEEAFRHPLFGSSASIRKLVPDPELLQEFLAEQQRIQAKLKGRLQQDPVWGRALDQSQLLPAVRLLQLMDALSLLLCFGGQQQRRLIDIPRSSWDDRIAIDWMPGEKRRIVCDPYPFDKDPLEVFLPARIIPADPTGIDDAASAADDSGCPITRLYSMPLQFIRFELTSQS
jgi:hypothetical protein